MNSPYLAAKMNYCWIVNIKNKLKTLNSFKPISIHP